MPLWVAHETQQAQNVVSRKSSICNIFSRPTDQPHPTAGRRAVQQVRGRERAGGGGALCPRARHRAFHRLLRRAGRPCGRQGAVRGRRRWVCSRCSERRRCVGGDRAGACDAVSRACVASCRPGGISAISAISAICLLRTQTELHTRHDLLRPTAPRARRRRRGRPRAEPAADGDGRAAGVVGFFGGGGGGGGARLATCVQGRGARRMGVGPCHAHPNQPTLPHSATHALAGARRSAWAWWQSTQRPPFRPHPTHLHRSAWAWWSSVRPTAPTASTRRCCGRGGSTACCTSRRRTRARGGRLVVGG